MLFLSDDFPDWHLTSLVSEFFYAKLWYEMPYLCTLFGMNLKSAGVKLGKPAGAEAMGFSHISLALSIEKCELLRDVVAPWALKDSLWKSLRCWNKVMEPVADIVDLNVLGREIVQFRALFQDIWNYNAPKWNKIQVPSNRSFHVFWDSQGRAKPHVLVL